MAVKKTVTFPGGVKAPDLYLLIDRVAVDRVRGRITFGLLGFIDEPTRRAAGAAHARLAAAEIALAAAQGAAAAARAAAAVPVSDPVTAGVLRKSLAAAGGQQMAAQAELEDASAEAQSPALAPAIDSQGQIAPADVGKVLRADGSVDMAAFYGALKQSGQVLEGGTDA